MKTNEQRQQEAKAAQAAKQEEAMQYLKQIEARIAAYAERANQPGFNWAMAGDMAHIAEQLKEIAQPEGGLNIQVEPAAYKDIIGTGFQGYLQDATYKDLVRVFGKPNQGSEDGKTRYQWIGRIFGLVFTIYDYKDDTPVNKMRTWHVGGKKQVVADLVNRYFQQNR